MSARASLVEYAGLTKPGITALIVLVAVGGYFLAAPAPYRLLPLGLLVLFGGLASGGAAMLNHYFDRDVDARMARTRGRALPEGRIAPSARVLLVGSGLLGLGVVGTGLLLNPLCGVAVLAGGATYVGIYTVWLKRRSAWNIVIGGFAGSAPALAGSAAALGQITPAAWALALVLFLWTPPHFWSLALLLERDYRAAGLPMLPSPEDPGRSGRIVVLSAALLLPATGLLWWAGSLPLPLGIALVGLGVAFVGLTAPLWRAPERRWARRGFIFSGLYLLLFLALVILAALLLHPSVVGT